MHCTYPSAYGVLESKIISIRDMCVHNGAFQTAKKIALSVPNSHAHFLGNQSNQSQMKPPNLIAICYW